MLAATLRDQGMKAPPGRLTHNHFRDTQYNYNECTTTRDIDYYRQADFNDATKLNDTGINNPIKPANVYIGSKNIYPIMESKGFTGLEAYASGKNNKNILPFKNTFGPRQYYTYC